MSCLFQSGIMIGNKLAGNRVAECCNEWQPLANVSDKDSQALNIPISGMTG